MQTSTLTVGADVIDATQCSLNGGTVQLATRPSSGDDTFNALSNDTLNTGDVLDGLGGVDTLSSRFTITAAKIIAPDTRNIEIHKVRLDHNGGAADAVTYNMADVVGATEVWSYRSENTGSVADAVLTFTGSGMNTGVALGIQGGDTGADNSSIDVTAVYRDVAGTADTSVLKLNGAGANVVTIAGIETLNIETSKTETSANAKGDSKLNSLVAADAKTINISGDGKLTLSATDFNNTAGYTVDASKSTGAVIANLEASAKQTFVGGSGNDEIFVGASLETTDSFDGGSGTADVFGHTTGTSAKITNVKNFEILDVTGTNTGSFDLTHYTGSSIGTVRIGGTITTSATVGGMIEAGTLLLTKATGVAAVTMNHKDTGVVGFTGGVLNVKFASDTAVDDTTTLTLGGASTVNIDVRAATAGTAKGTINHEIDGALTATLMTKLVLTGDQNLKIAAFTSSAALVNFDASQMTGKVEMTAALLGTGATLVKGGTGDDTLTPNNAAVSEVWGGKGADTIGFGATSAKGTYVVNSKMDGCAVGTINTTTDDTVTGFVRTQDKIGISESFLRTLGNQDDTLAVLVSGSANQAVGTNDAVIFTTVSGGVTLMDLQTTVGTFSGSRVGLELLLMTTTAGTAHNVWHFGDANGNGYLDAGEVTLIGTITTDSGSLVATDVVRVTGTY